MKCPEILKLSKRYPALQMHIFGLGLFTVVSVSLTAGGLFSVFKQSARYGDLALLALGLSLAAFIGLEMAKFFTGEVVHIESISVILKEGELAFDEPEGPFEIWIFCRVPFGRYHGTIKIIRNEPAEDHCIQLPSPQSWRPKRGRKDTSPVIWRSPKYTVSRPAQCRVKFNLTPNFRENKYDADGVETITLMVKSV